MKLLALSCLLIASNAVLAFNKEKEPTQPTPNADLSTMFYNGQQLFYSKKSFDKAINPMLEKAQQQLQVLQYCAKHYVKCTDYFFDLVTMSEVSVLKQISPTSLMVEEGYRSTSDHLKESIEKLSQEPELKNIDKDKELELTKELILKGAQNVLQEAPWYSRPRIALYRYVFNKR